MAHRSTSSYEFEDEEQNMERHIQYNKRGELQMVGEKSLFDLNEPVWHADEKVRAWWCLSRCTLSYISQTSVPMGLRRVKEI